MAENAKIAALRAASSAAPQGPSGPEALAYEWMTRRGSDLVMPNRPPIDQEAWRQGRVQKAKRPPAVPGQTVGRGKSQIPPGFSGADVLAGGGRPDVSYDMGGFSGMPVEEPSFDMSYDIPVPEVPSYQAPAFNIPGFDQLARVVPQAPAEAPPSFELVPMDVDMYSGIDVPAAPVPTQVAPQPSIQPELAMIDPSLFEMIDTGYAAPRVERRGRSYFL